MIVNTISKPSGLVPLIVVTAPTGSTVTCDSIVGTESSGTWTFKVAIGNHTIVATSQDQSQTKTETVVVDAVAIYPITISYSRLPSGFQECEWIASSGTQYINTGYIPTGYNTFGFEIDGCFIDTTSSKYMIGAERSNYNLIGIECVGTTEIRGVVGWGGVSYNYSSTERRKYGITQGSLYVNNVKIGDGDSRSRVQTTYSFFIFGKNTNNDKSLLALTSSRLYEVLFYEDTTFTTPVRDYIPCYCTETVTAYQGSTQTTASAGTIGMYDLIGNRFYINSGSGTFTKGDDV